MSFNAPEIDYAGISPIIALTAGVVLVLVAGLFGSRTTQRVVVSVFGLGTLATAAGLCIWQWGEAKDLVAGTLRIDDLALAATLIAIASPPASASRSPGASRPPTGRSGRAGTASSRRCCSARCSGWR